MSLILFFVKGLRAQVILLVFCSACAWTEKGADEASAVPRRTVPDEGVQYNHEFISDGEVVARLH